MWLCKYPVRRHILPLSLASTGPLPPFPSWPLKRTCPFDTKAFNTLRMDLDRLPKFTGYDDKAF